MNTSNLANTYLTKLKKLRMVVYGLSGIISKNRNVSDGKFLPKCAYFVSSLSEVEQKYPQDSSKEKWQSGRISSSKLG